MSKSKPMSDALRAKIEQLSDHFENMVAAAENLNKDIESEALSARLSEDRKHELICEIDSSAKSVSDTFDGIAKLKLNPDLIEEWSITVERLRYESDCLIQLVSKNEVSDSSTIMVDLEQEENEQVDIAIQRLEAQLDAMTTRAEQLHKPILRPKIRQQPDTSRLHDSHNQSSNANQDLSFTGPSSTIGQGSSRSLAEPSDQYVTTSSMHMMFRELKDALVENNSNTYAPAPEPAIFRGNPLEYPDWIAAFDGLIDAKKRSPMEKLHHLRRYLDGPAKKAVSGYFMLQSEKAYIDAKALLKQRFGNPHLITLAFREHLSKWSKVANRDGRALQELADFLCQCRTAMQLIPGLRALNDSQEIHKIMNKLPDQIADRWIRIADRKIAKYDSFPEFDEFCEFMQTEARVACNPLRAGNTASSQLYNSPTPKRLSYTTKTRENNDAQQRKCLFCKRDNHLTVDCFKLAKQPHVKQEEFVKTKRLCFGCLKPGHMTRQCRNRAKCSTCSKPHPTSLHRDRVVVGEMPDDHSSNDSQNQEANHVTCSATSNKPNTCSLAVPVWVSAHGNKKEMLVYALLDSQSDTSFVTSKIASALGSNQVDTTLNLTTMTAENMTLPCKKVAGLSIRGHNSNVTIKLPALFTRETIPAVREHIPNYETVKAWPHLSKIVKEMSPKLNAPVALLIGYNCPQAFIPRCCITGGNEQPFAIKSDLGWMVMGHTANDIDKQFSHRIFSEEAAVPHDPQRKHLVFKSTANQRSIEPVDILNALHADFQNENLNETDEMSVEDNMFLHKISSEIHQDDQKFITMPLPLKAKPPANQSKAAAVHRFSLLEKKFQKDHSYSHKYKKFMNEIISHGDAEPVPKHEIDCEQSWYIPHFGVFHPKKPDKLRVVFDCSAKVGGVSLNDFLLQGPEHMNNLTGILVRFRKERVAVMCDVERMFHQFRVKANDCDYLRFLWYDDKGDVIDYRMKVHIFGAKSSPACATYGLRHVAQLSKLPSVHGFITNDFYVDDGLTSLPTVEAAKELITNATSTCAQANIRLHKFISNSTEVMKAVPASERTDKVLDLDITAHDALPTERALGIQWNVSTDCFQFRVAKLDKPATRRGILSTVASIFDPLGLIAPITLKGKIILQKMCTLKIGWDDQLPENLQSEWVGWKGSLNSLCNISIPRCYKPTPLKEITRAEIHNFSDASTIGYGQCSYLRLVDSDGNVSVSLVMAKARVAPLHTVTIPRLELQAACTSSKISKFIESAVNISNIEQFYWTDSIVVLSYIANESRRFHPYVANRVQTIRAHSEPQQWYYVPSADNPADHASRGSQPRDLDSSSWFPGPEFLWSNPMQIPCQPDVVLKANDPEVKSTCHTNHAAGNHASITERLARFSSLKSARKAIACLQILVRSKVKRCNDNDDDVEHIRRAEKFIVLEHQKEHFSNEICALSNKKQLKPDSLLAKLCPYLDESGLLRVGGRLKASSEMAYDEKHPIILPKTGHITTLIVRHHHERIAHQGKGITLAAIQSAGYWLMSGHKVVSSMISKCITCQKIRGKLQHQQMAPLPQDRVDSAPPFTYCGCDCFGPFLVKDGRKECKRYGLLFTCMASRAIHIELLDDLTSDSFINGLRRFVAIRGPVTQLRCDRGTNFVGALSELAKEIESNYSHVHNQCKSMNISFLFNPPSASHMGGVWERQIRTVRNVLLGVTKKHGGRFDTTTLRTIMYEVMAIVNSRPLTQTADNTQPLTPNMLLTMKTDVVLPMPGSFSESDIYSKKRWRQVQHIANEFWKRWRSEYLSQLQTRQKWHEKQPNVRVGDIVLLHEADLVRNEWKLARVSACKASDDGLVRSVDLLLANKNYGLKNHQTQVLTRPISKIVVLMSTQ